MYTLADTQFYYLKVEFKGSKLFRYVFVMQNQLILQYMSMNREGLDQTARSSGPLLFAYVIRVFYPRCVFYVRKQFI